MIFILTVLLNLTKLTCAARNVDITLDYLRSLGYNDSLEWTVGQLTTNVGLELPGNSFYDYCMFAHVGMSLSQDNSLIMSYPSNATHDYTLGELSANAGVTMGPEIMEVDNKYLNLTDLWSAQDRCAKYDPMNFVQDSLTVLSSSMIASRLFQPEDFAEMMEKFGWDDDEEGEDTTPDLTKRGFLKLVYTQDEQDCWNYSKARPDATICHYKGAGYNNKKACSCIRYVDSANMCKTVEQEKYWYDRRKVWYQVQTARWGVRLISAYFLNIGPFTSEAMTNMYNTDHREL